MPPSLRALARAAGTPVVDSAGYAVRLAAVVGEGLLLVAGRGFRLRPVVRQVLYRQVYFTGVRAIPFTALLALLVAVVVAVQAPWSAAAGGRDLLGRILAVVVIRELGPTVVALVVVARSGTAMAAELAMMRVDGEIDALAGMGVDPFEYLVVPRLLGTALSMLALTVFFLGMSLGASALLSPLLGGPPPRDLVEVVARALHAGDAAALLAKTVVPGLAVAAVACLEGLSAWRSNTDVPPAVTAAVVRAISLAFVWNTVVSLFLYLA